MSLSAKDVTEITKLLEESEFDELHLELDGMKISLRRSGSAARDSAPLPAPPRTAFPGGAAAPAAGTSAAAASRPVDRQSAAATDGASRHTVTAPLLGTFYRSPRPGAPPFVETGTEVEPETVVCIIEVMKLMNTVRAGVRGRVAQVIAHDGALVEYGEALLQVSRTGDP